MLEVQLARIMRDHCVMTANTHLKIDNDAPVRNDRFDSGGHIADIDLVPASHPSHSVTTIMLEAGARRRVHAANPCCPGKM